MIDEAKDLMKYHSTRCPECESPKHTSRLPEGATNFDNMYNQCLDCGHDFTPEEALPSLASVEASNDNEQ